MPTQMHMPEANLFEFLLLLHQWSQVRVHVEPGLTWSISDIPSPLCNSLWRTQLACDEVDGAIETAIARGRARDVPLLWWTGPTAKPDNLEIRLLHHGFVDIGDIAGMKADLSTLDKAGVHSHSGLTVEQVRDTETLQEYCHVLTTGFGEPASAAEAWLDWLTTLGLETDVSLRHYLGRVDAEPVGISSLFFGAGVAGIHNVATLPDTRRQGIGTAMTLAAAHDARAAGHRTAVLQATELGYNVYRQLGFRDCCRIGRYVWANEKENL